MGERDERGHISLAPSAGTTPAAIDACLRVADEYDVAVTIHTDTLNESSCVVRRRQGVYGAS